MAPHSSSVQEAKRLLGDRLRELRADAGLTGRELGRLTGWHSSKVSKIEYGKQTPTPDDIQLWCRHTGAESQTSDLIASLRIVEGMFVEWRRMERTGLRRAQEMVAPLWERTRHFRAYDSWLIPGLFQTAAYTEALLRAIVARRGLIDDVAEAVAVRMQRQAVLQDSRCRFAVVVEESVLRSRIGDTQTMAGQLGHLLTLGTLPTVSLGIVPMHVERTLRPVEGFWIFDDERVNVELVSGWLTITQPHEVAMYGRTFAQLTEHALYGGQARNLIAAAISALDAPTRP